MKPFTEQHKKLYNSLFNNLNENNIYENLNIDNYIIEKKRFLMSYIENNKNWSIGTKKLYYFMCARYLLNNNFERYSKLYSQAGYNLKLQIEQKEGLNLMDSKEIENIKEYSYFVNILESIDYENINNIIDHYKYLLLSLMVYQAPLRTSFYKSCKIIRKKVMNDKINNFLLINRRGNVKITLIINKDKSTNYKFYNQNKEFSKINIEDPRLIKIINYSFIKYPRDYLFQNQKTNNMYNDKTLLELLRKITQIKGITINMMRSIYITHTYKNNLTHNEKLKLSHDMRHSVTTASLHYNKVGENTNITENCDKIINDLNNQIYELKKEIETLQLNNNNIDNNIDSKIFNKRKNDIMYLIKSGKTVKQSTKLKYNINI